MQKDYFKVGDKVFIIRELDEKRYADAQNGPGMMPRMKQWVNNFDLNLTVSHVGENHKDWLTVDNGEGESWTFNANDVAFAASRELGVGGKAIVFRKVCQYAGYPKASWPGDDHMIGQQINIKEVYNPTNLWEKHLRDVGGGYFDWRSLAPVRDDGVKEKKKKKEEVPTAPKEKPPLHELLNKGSGSGSCCSFAIRFEKDDYVYKDAPCHASFKRDYNNTKGNVVQAVESVSYHTQDMKEKEVKDYKTFVDYIINRSPWKDCFLTKDIDKAFDEGIYYNVEMDHAQILSAAVALRTGSEFEYTVKGFIENLADGWEEKTALFMAYFFDRANRQIRPLTDGHHTLSVSQSAEGVLNFFSDGKWNENIVKHVPWTKKDNYAISRAIAPNGYDRITDPLINWLQAQVNASETVDAGFAKVVKFSEDERKKLFSIVEKRLNK